MKPWTVLSSQPLIDRPWLRIRQERILLPSGKEIEEFHVIDSMDWAAALALTPDSKVILVEQYRHGIGGTSRELPAGIIEQGETPLEAARRELLEETGFEADDWQLLTCMATEPSRHSTRAHFFTARSARRVAQQDLDPSEDLEVRLIDAPDLLASVASGEISHAVHIAAILLAMRAGRVG